jgi:hypothetical protein
MIPTLELRVALFYRIAAQLLRFLKDYQIQSRVSVAIAPILESIANLFQRIAALFSQPIRDL